MSGTWSHLCIAHVKSLKWVLHSSHLFSAQPHGMRGPQLVSRESHAPPHPSTPAPLHLCTPAPPHLCTPAPLHPALWSGQVFLSVTQLEDGSPDREINQLLQDYYNYPKLPDYIPWGTTLVNSFFYLKCCCCCCWKEIFRRGLQFTAVLQSSELIQVSTERRDSVTRFQIL